jgi:hypothetical protein
MSSKTEWFYEQAAQCLSRARHASDATIRVYFLNLARKWLELADVGGVRALSPTEPQLFDCQRH